MKTPEFSRILGALLWLASAGCAESAIPDPDEASGDGDDDGVSEDASISPVDEAPDAKLDARVTVRDAGPGDAGDGGAGSVTDASSADATVRDAGGDAARPDAGGDAGKPDAATPPDASTPPDAAMPPSCQNGQTTCSDSCVDTRTDVNNCGGCGTKCGSGQSCSNSACTGGGTNPPMFSVPNGCQSKTYNNHGYAFCRDSKTWQDARKACLDAKLELAIINDAAENGFVDDNGESWFAANDLTNEGQWQYPTPGNASRTNGSAVSYTNWSSGEPNNTEKCDGVNIYVGCLGERTTENCGMLRTDGKWNDTTCSERRGFVCETY